MSQGFSTFLVGLLLLVLAWGLAVATAKDEQVAAAVETNSHFIIFHPLYREFGTEGLIFEATAARARFEQQTNQAVARQLRGKHFNADRATRIFAMDGHYDLGNEVGTLEGEVRIRNDEGYTLTTTSAVYHHMAKRITAAGAFQAQGGGVTLHGVGLIYDLPADTFSVERNVGASIAGFRL
jgi:LPS export ABC transporter protein LptC